MAAFVKVQPFVEALAEGRHNLGADQLRVVCCAAASPPLNTNGQLSNLTTIDHTNLSSRNVTTATSAQSAGTYRLVCNDLVLTAVGGAVPAFRYVALYNDTALNDELVGFYDYGSEITLAPDESLTVDFDGVNGVLSLT